MRVRAHLPSFALASGGVAVALLAAATILGVTWSTDTWVAISQVWSLAWVGFPVVGTVVAAKRPDTRVGWLLIGAGLVVGLSQLTRNWASRALHDAPGSLPGGELAASFAPTEFLGFVLLGLALLYFPQDRLTSRFGRNAARFAAVVVAATVFVWAFRSRTVLELPGGGGEIVVARPLFVPGLSPLADAVGDLPGLAGVLFLMVMVAGLVVRAFRSSGVERQQMKWLAYAGALFLLAAVVLLTAEIVTGGLPPLAETSMAVAAFVICFNAMAASVGLAVLRYRLYDIDRVASRTATYAVLSLGLAGVYAAGVVLLGGALRPVLGDGGGDLVVAASTLAVAAAFAPMRHRVQRSMDRRFNRRGVDAQRTVEAFTQRLRDEVDLGQVVEHLGEVSARSLQPARVGVWLRGEGWAS